MLLEVKNKIFACMRATVELCEVSRTFVNRLVIGSRDIMFQQEFEFLLILIKLLAVGTKSGMF